MKKKFTYLILLCGLMMMPIYTGCSTDDPIVDDDVIVDDGDKPGDGGITVDGNKITAQYKGEDLEIEFKDGGTFTVLAGENSDVGNGEIVISTGDKEAFFNAGNSVVFDFSKTSKEYAFSFEYELPKNLVDEDVTLYFYAADSVAQKFEAVLVDFNYDESSGVLKAKFKAPSDDPTRSSGSKYSRLVLSFSSRSELAEQPKEHIVKMPFYEQPGGSCWATCATMMGRAYSAVADRKREVKVIDFLKYMNQTTLDDGIGLYSFKRWLPSALEIYSGGVKFETSTFVSTNNMLSEIIKKLNEDKPMIMNLSYPVDGRHVILIIGYKIEMVSAAKISLQLLYHNPSDGMYKWADYDWLMKDKWPQEAFQILYAKQAVPASRSLSTLGMPLKHQDGELSFIVPMKNAQGKDVEFDINMVYDLEAEYKYHWEFSYGNEKIDAVPDSASVMRLKLPVYNAAQSSKQLAIVYRAYERESGKRLLDENVIETYNAGTNYYKAEIPVSKFYYTDEDSEEMEERVKVRMEIELWDGGTFNDGYTIYFDVEQKQKVITLVTSKSIGETINLGFLAKPADESDVWIDLNDNNKRDSGEGVTLFGDMADYTLQSQTISIYGDITGFACGENEITKLELIGCKGLEVLYCYQNKITELDVSGCTALEDLWCNYNEISKLDVSGCTMLEGVNFNNNKLTTLNFSGLKALKGVWCGNNQLTSLDISGCTALEELFCHNNRLTSLDVRSSTALSYLNCENNKISSLDVSGFKALTNLYCDKNQLTTLNINGCTALEALDCTSNGLMGIVPDIFEDIWLLYYDVRYKYSWDSDVEKYVMTEDTGRGWWYSHEPEGGCHRPTPCN